MNEEEQMQTTETETENEVIQEVAQPSEAEVRASEQGWMPQDKWQGDPDKWVSAETFLERGEKHNGILRERNEKLNADIIALKEELRSSVRQFGTATRKAEERAFQRAMKELHAEQVKAVEQGDTQTWSELEKEKTSLQSEFVEAQKEPEQSPDQDPAFISWHTHNQWYNDDLDLTVYANQVAPILAPKYGNKATPEFYEAVAKAVKKKYPEKFRNSNRDKPSPVQNSAQDVSKGKANKGKKYNDLPPEAKAACDKFVNQQMMTQEEYLAEYFSE